LYNRDSRWLMVNTHFSVPDKDIVEGRS